MPTLPLPLSAEVGARRRGPWHAGMNAAARLVRNVNVAAQAGRWSGLVFVFVPVYLLVGGFVTLGIGLAFGTRLPIVGQCQECGYHLKGLIEPRCPGCGTPFELHK